MPQQEKYVPDNGVAVFSPYGYQRLQSQANGSFYFYSDICDDVLINNKWMIDYIWESGDYFYIAGNTVYRKGFDGVEKASLVLDGPVSVAAVQPLVPLEANQVSSDEVATGCWISDAIGRRLVRTDSNLTEIKEIINMGLPSILIGCPDGGCYIFDDGHETIYKVTANAKIEGRIAYSDIYINNSSEILSADSDIANCLWVVHGYSVKKITLKNGRLSYTFEKQMITSLSLGSGYVSDLSVEKSITRDSVYVTGCYIGGSWIAKLNLNGSVAAYNPYLSGICPTIVKASQWGYSDCIYLVSEDSDYLPDECEISSSSSSLDNSSSSSS